MSKLLNWIPVEAYSSWSYADGKAGNYRIHSGSEGRNTLSLPDGSLLTATDEKSAQEAAEDFELRFIATQKPTTSKFWMVFGTNQGAPNYRHHSLVSAQEEARRLSKNNHGITFVVLEAVDAYQAEEPKVHQFDIGAPTRCDYDGIPF